MGPTVYKLLGTAVAVLAGVVAKNAAQRIWTMTTGKEPPANPEDPEVSWAEAVSWAVASGAVIGIARLLATRKAAQYYQRATGELPPGVNQVQ